MDKPTLHLISVAGNSPEEQVALLARLVEKVTGKKPTEEELQKALTRAKEAAKEK